MSGAARAQKRRSITARELAERLGSSERTARRLVAEPWDEYLARAAERRKRAVELRKQGLKYPQIAKEMGISTGSVGSLIHDARKHGELNMPLYTRPSPETGEDSAENSSA
jgi:DNA-directed RNA polymerase specialized sigma24 family protein